MTVSEIISIHALVKRATSDRTARQHKGLDFNPRPREEGDSGYGYCSCRSGNFNPRPREEGDVCQPRVLTYGFGFQSTPS